MELGGVVHELTNQLIHEPLCSNHGGVGIEQLGQCLVRSRLQQQRVVFAQLILQLVLSGVLHTPRMVAFQRVTESRVVSQHWLERHHITVFLFHLCLAHHAYQHVSTFSTRILTGIKHFFVIHYYVLMSKICPYILMLRHPGSSEIIVAGAKIARISDTAAIRLWK